MDLKKTKIIATIGIFLLAFPLHFLYDLWPNPIFSIFFPVNESIWEHMKLIYTSIMLYGIIDYMLLSYFHLPKSNFLCTLWLTATLAIPIYLALFLPFYYKIGHHMLLTLILLFITIAITQIISFFLLSQKNYTFLNYLALLLILIAYIIFGFLTYHPIRQDLFFDTEKEKYGIHLYRI